MRRLSHTNINRPGHTHAHDLLLLCTRPQGGKQTTGGQADDDYHHSYVYDLMREREREESRKPDPRVEKGA